MRLTGRRASMALGLVAASATLAGCGSGHEASPASMRPILASIVRYEDQYRGDKGWGPMFCGVRYLGGSPSGRRFRLYVWEACQEYQARHGRLVEQTGWSAPAALTIVRSGDRYRVVDEEQPADYENLPAMFPSSHVRSEIFKLDGSNATGPGMPATMFAADKRQAEKQLLSR